MTTPQSHLEATSPSDADSTLGPRMICGSSEMREVMTLIDRVARSSSTVLVTGESGTGKEVAVTRLHASSPRAKAPLVIVNCGAIPEQLLESELFGHAKGAFTGAHAARVGRVAAAEGGTLFLDEVGELPLALQVKLLRLLQQREYSPVGETRTSRCDIRIVAATNRELEKDVAAGRFREDLFYRLNVIRVDLPPLRDRPGDIEALSQHFFDVHVARSGRGDLTGFTKEAQAALVAHPWPGNIRALENAIEHAVVLAAGPTIDVCDLPSPVRGAAVASVESKKGASTLPDVGLDLRGAVERFENELILQALERTGWNKQRAAQLLRLNRTTLVEMMKRKNLAA